MSDFLGKLAARSLGAADVVRAVVPSLFEPYRRNLGPQTKRRQGLATDPARQLETETIGDASPAQTATRVQPAAATFDPQTVKSSNAPPDLRGARQGSNGPLEVRGASSASPLNGLDPPAVQPTGHLTPAPAFFSRGHSSVSPTHLPGSPVPSIDSLETLSKPAQGVVSPGRSSVSPAHLSGSLAPSLDPREAPKLTPLPASPDWVGYPPNAPIRRNPLPRLRDLRPNPPRLRTLRAARQRSRGRDQHPTIIKRDPRRRRAQCAMHRKPLSSRPT